MRKTKIVVFDVKYILTIEELFKVTETQFPSLSRKSFASLQKVHLPNHNYFQFRKTKEIQNLSNFGISSKFDLQK